MVQLSFERGLSKHSANGFCVLGAIISRQGDNNLGYRLGKIALLLLHKFGAKEELPLLYNSYYNFISPYKDSIHKTFVPLLTSYKIGLEIGYHILSVTSAVAYFKHSFIAGISLYKLMDECEDLLEANPSYSMQTLFFALYQATINLTDVDKKEPANLNGIFDASTLNKENFKKNDAAKCAIVCGYIAYLFYDYAMANKFFNIRRSQNMSLHEYSYPIFILYEGLVILAMVQSKEENITYTKNVEENISILRSLAEDAPDNYSNKLHMLEAQMAMLNDDESEAEKHYQEAISLSKQHGFVNEEAVICERVGIFFLDSDGAKATQFLLQAHACYKDWGATRKMKHLTETYPSYLNDKSIDSTARLCPFTVDATSQSSISQITMPRLGWSHENKRSRLDR